MKCLVLRKPHSTQSTETFVNHKISCNKLTNVNISAHTYPHTHTPSSIISFRHTSIDTSIDTALHKISYIVLHTKFNNQAMRDMCAVRLKLHLVDFVDDILY